MTPVYVMLIVTSVYAGSYVHTQEFAGKESCEKAAKDLVSMTHARFVGVLCVPKGKP